MANWNPKGRICFTKDEEFDEEDVWSTTATESGDCNGHYNPSVFSSSSSSSSSSLQRLHSSPRKIPEVSSKRKTEAKLGQRSSASVNIPDWSKICGKNTGTGSWADYDHDDGNFMLHNGNGSHKVQNFDADYDDGNGDSDDDDNELIPPHEWIAKKLAGTQISSSVYEGIGRTLKGRDLSKLRNAILAKTGFLE